ncbi:uncharacterized protein [Triticum aestivum]|uniref:uncharacterized protein n=1 Tax=Triticum aestivum TaxID=4565 RepID=UPI001D020AA5|nr:uncharacterized protein LOC123056106 [Triticum aestivum]
MVCLAWSDGVWRLDHFNLNFSSSVASAVLHAVWNPPSAAALCFTPAVAASRPVLLPFSLFAELAAAAARLVPSRLQPLASPSPPPVLSSAARSPCPCCSTSAIFSYSSASSPDLTCSASIPFPCLAALSTAVVATYSPPRPSTSGRRSVPRPHRSPPRAAGQAAARSTTTAAVRPDTRPPQLLVRHCCRSRATAQLLCSNPVKVPSSPFSIRRCMCCSLHEAPLCCSLGGDAGEPEMRFFGPNKLQDKEGDKFLLGSNAGLFGSQKMVLVSMRMS